MKSKREQVCTQTMGDCEEIETNGEQLSDEKSELESKHLYNFHYELENEFLGDENFNDENNEEDDVYVLLAQKEKDLLLAAELGKALLEKNEELTQKYERLQEDYSQQAEELEQDKYELRLKIERISGSHESRVQELQADVQSLRQELRSLKSASLTDSAHKRKTFAGLTEENEKLHSELYQLRTDNEALSEELTKLKGQQLSRSFSIDDHNQQIEIEELCEKISRLEEERSCLRQNVEELESTKDVLAKDNEELRAKIQEIKKNSEDVKSQLEDTEEKLNESKTNCLFLQDQLDEWKIQASLDQASRGSLFSELSDMSGSLLDNDDLCLKDGQGGKTKENSRQLRPVLSVNGSPRPLACSSSNKRPRQHFSVDSDEEDSDDSDLEYDENECEVDGPVTRNVDFYAQLEKEHKFNAELKKEITDAHNELRTLYDKLRWSHDKPTTKVEPLDPSRDFHSGYLTSFVQIFKDVIDDIMRTRKISVSRKNSGYAGSMVGSVHDNLKEQIRQLKEDLYQAHKEMEHLKEENVTAHCKIKQKLTEISDLQEKLNKSTDEIKHLKEERKRLVLKECDPNLAFDAVYQQALLDKEEALRREGQTAIELEKCKREAERLDKHLMEAIQQKIDLSEQLEDWQYDMAALIDEQVQKQMRTTSSEQEEARTARRKLFPKGWNWSTSSPRKQTFTS